MKSGHGADKKRLLKKSRCHRSLRNNRIKMVLDLICTYGKRSLRDSIFRFEEAKCFLSSLNRARTNDFTGRRLDYDFLVGSARKPVSVDRRAPKGFATPTRGAAAVRSNTKGRGY